jgi:hypothetical protein
MAWRFKSSPPHQNRLPFVLHGSRMKVWALEAESAADDHSFGPSDLRRANERDLGDG